MPTVIQAVMGIILSVFPKIEIYIFTELDLNSIIIDSSDIKNLLLGGHYDTLTTIGILLVCAKSCGVP